MRFVCFVCVLFAIPSLGADPELATVLVLGTAGPGSGAVVQSKAGESLVLTNKHVCPHDGDVRIRAAGKLYAAKWLGASADYDLAALRVQAELPALELAANEPAEGATVRLFGYGGLPKSGKVIGADGSRFPGKGDCWRIGFEPAGGDSGAPLIDSDGNLAGIVWGFRNADHVGLAVRLNEVKQVVKQFAK